MVSSHPALIRAWKWLGLEANRAALGLIGGALVALISAGWALFLYSDRARPDPAETLRNQGIQATADELIKATKGSNGRVVELLLAAGVSPNQPGSGDEYALTAAIENHDVVTTKTLLRGGADPNLPLEGGRTGLMYAASEGAEDLVKLLLAHDGSRSFVSRTGDSATIWAVSGGSLSILRRLVTKETVNTAIHLKEGWWRGDGSPHDGDTPLSLAVRLGRLELVQFLLARGAETAPKNRDPAICDTFDAPDAQRAPILDTLLTSSVSVDAVCTYASPIALAVFHDDRSTFQALISKRPDLTLLGSWGTPPLSVAAERCDGSHGREDYYVHALLSAGADPNARAQNGDAAIHAAAESWSDLSCARELLLNGADPNLAGEHGDTALLRAVREGGGNEMIALILSSGGNPLARDADGKTALMILMARHRSAASNYLAKSIPTLLKAGIDRAAVDRSGRTALDYARLEDNCDYLSYFDETCNLQKRLGHGSAQDQ